MSILPTAQHRFRHRPPLIRMAGQIRRPVFELRDRADQGNRGHLAPPRTPDALPGLRSGVGRSSTTPATSWTPVQLSDRPRSLRPGSKSRIEVTSP